MTKLALPTVIACAALAPAYAQLYLIAGTPTPKYNVEYSTVLAVVNADGSVTATQELVPAKFGMEWMTTSFDARKALILPKGPGDHMVVFDFDTASVVKSCEQPELSGLVFVSQWLVNSPSHGLTYVQYLPAFDRRDGNTDQLLGMIMDPAVPCQDSFVKLGTNEVKYVAADGFAGIADAGAGDRMDASLSPDGALSGAWLNGSRTYYDYKVPPSLFSDMKQPHVAITVNNKEILGLQLGYPPDMRVIVLRKRDQTWHRAPDQLSGRAFGSFIAAPEMYSRSRGGPESAGKAEWRKVDAPTGPAIAERLSASRLQYPGILHLYDAATETFYTINTNQGDSEIILVENGTVYYRVSDRLYSAPINPATTTIGPPQLLATSDLIRDAHWALIKH